MLTKEDVIHEIFKKVMFVISESFYEDEDAFLESYDEYDEDDYIPEEKITTNILEEKIRNAISLAIEEMVESGEISVD